MPDLTLDIDSTAAAEIEDHCFSRTDVEVGGFLIGRIDQEGTHILASTRALEANSGQTQLTITHADWDAALSVLDKDFPGMAIVGWYHSHPGFGCFLSAQDQFIQGNFFSAPGQVALVVDPLKGRYEYFVAEDGATVTVDAGDTALGALAAEGEDKADLVMQAVPRRRMSPVAWGGIVVALLIVGLGAWFVGVMQGNDQARATSGETIAALNGQVEDLVQALSEATSEPEAAKKPVVEEPAKEEPTPEPEPVALEDPGPAPLSPGDPVTVTISHTVQRGDNWWDLARRYLGSGERYEELAAANPSVTMLIPGQALRIPVEAKFVALVEDEEQQ